MASQSCPIKTPFIESRHFSENFECVYQETKALQQIDRSSLFSSKEYIPTNFKIQMEEEIDFSIAQLRSCKIICLIVAF